MRFISVNEPGHRSRTGGYLIGGGSCAARPGRRGQRGVPDLTASLADLGARPLDRAFRRWIESSGQQALTGADRDKLQARRTAAMAPGYGQPGTGYRDQLRHPSEPDGDQRARHAAVAERAVNSRPLPFTVAGDEQLNAGVPTPAVNTGARAARTPARAGEAADPGVRAASRQAAAGRAVLAAGRNTAWLGTAGQGTSSWQLQGRHHARADRGK